MSLNSTTSNQDLPLVTITYAAILLCRPFWLLIIRTRSHSSLPVLTTTAAIARHSCLITLSDVLPWHVLF